MLQNKYNASESEPKWQKFWQEKGIYKFDQNSDKPIYSIDTPPPTVNGHIHMGHIFSYSQAEFVARYKRMTGYNVFYPFGFDDNGLPTELYVEKTHKVKAHEIGREKFRQLCYDTVQSLEEDFKNLFISVGNSADWDLLYHTVSKESQRASQLSFLDLYNKDKSYCASAPALWCTKCRTSIAQSELESVERESTFNYLKFFIEGSDEFVEIATTRPELLCACDCILINPKDEKNKHLLSKRIRIPLYDFSVPVLTDDKVDMDKGSGVVMCCTFGDQTDAQWFKKYKLEYKKAIDDGGFMTEIAGKYFGMKVRDARAQIIEDLKENGYMLKQENITHQVSVHERCGTETEINLKRQWFIKTLENKDTWRKIGDEINWYPNFMKSRYTDWVDNLIMDWCISRQKYFGVPIPVWYCKDCQTPIIADADQLPVNPITDKPKGNCPHCGGANFEPEIDILDTWATSSLTPQINCKWKVNDVMFNKLFPMTLRPNAHDIIRTWDFYTIVKAFYHNNSRPWDNVMISGFLMAGKGEKVSKSKSNAKQSTADFIKQYSADVVRYWTATGSLGRDIILSQDELKNGAKIVNKLYNAGKFIWQFIEGYKPKTVDLLPMDRWVIAKYNKMFESFKKHFDKYEIGLAMTELESFFWNFCDNYIEISKNRLYKPEIYGEDAKLSAQYTIYTVFLKVLQLFAIYLPHVTEEIYQNTFKETQSPISIHKFVIGKIESEDGDEIIKNGDFVVNIISLIRQYKSENKLSLKTEISKVEITCDNEEFVSSCMAEIQAVTSTRDVEISKCDFNVKIGQPILDIE